MKYPVLEIYPQIKESLEKFKVTIIKSPTGSGKTTILPAEFIKENLFSKKIILAEPRRLAAKNSALRISELIENKNSIGYQVRNEKSNLESAKLIAMTNGILLRRIQSDPELKEFDLVILDEFHERSIELDIVFSFLVDTIEVYRPDLKLIILSATIDTSSIKKRIDCNEIHSEGKLFPVKVNYSANDSSDLESIKKLILEIIHKEGDILVFLSGESEIHRLKNLLSEIDSSIELLSLYGNLDFKAQNNIINKKTNHKRVILSTNIAESSLTITGIKTVIDSGFAKFMRYDSSSGFSRLVKDRISLNSAKQRSGRAGRESEGISYRMWTKENEKNFSTATKPEILESDLSRAILEISEWGSSFESLKLLDKPSDSVIQKNFQLLEYLCLLKSNKITEKGKRVLSLPLHPRIGTMLLESQNFLIPELGIILAIILEESFRYKTSSLNILDSIEEFFFKRDISEKYFKELKEILDPKLNFPLKNKLDLEKIGFLLAIAYPDRIAKRNKGTNKYKLANGKLAELSSNSIQENFIVIPSLSGERELSKIYLYSALNEDDIHFLYEKEFIIKENLQIRNHKVYLCKEKFYKEILLSSLETKPINSVMVEDFIIKKINELGISFFNLTDEFENFRNRILFLNQNGFNFFSLEEENLLKTLEQWYIPYLDSDFNLKKDIFSILKNQFSFEEMKIIEKEAPAKWKAPSGAFHKIDYSNSEIKISIKIQEIFGLIDTPRLANGKVPIQFEILSPGYKLVQKTKDLKNFWSKTYFEIKKELKGRYPKHFWPDDPFTIQATTKSKNYFK
jgi:ATP-dependent helicase HrpB